MQQYSDPILTYEWVSNAIACSPHEEARNIVYKVDGGIRDFLAFRQAGGGQSQIDQDDPLALLLSTERVQAKSLAEHMQASEIASKTISISSVDLNDVPATVVEEEDQTHGAAAPPTQPGSIEDPVAFPNRVNEPPAGNTPETQRDAAPASVPAALPHRPRAPARRRVEYTEASAPAPAEG